ncbi:MAG: PEGA domain-containing protein [Deltaproteobacteria bacterium]|nr:PEGA domain-containing protein [Deltaproteobacteria bacterium]
MRWLLLLLLGGCASAPPTPFPQLAQVKGREAPPGNLVLQTAPQDAQVAVDGVVQGLGSDFDGVHGALKLKEGEHSLKVTRDGYRPFAATVFTSDDGRQTLQVSLDKL